MTTTEAHRRHKFIQLLYNMSDRQRTHLLGIEADAELAALLEVAMDEQHFEMAVVIKQEVNRRAAEVKVEPDAAYIRMRDEHFHGADLKARFPLGMPPLPPPKP